MRLTQLLLVVWIGLVADAGAQTPPPPAERPADPPPVAATRPAREVPDRVRLELLTRRLAAELQLDEEQQARINELAEQHASADAAADREARIRGALSDLRAARERNDRARIADLARQIRELRGSPGVTDERFLADIEPLLRPEQREAFTRFRERWGADRRRQEAGGHRLDRMVLRLGDELNLTDDQRGEFDALVEQYRERFATHAARRLVADNERAALLRELRDARSTGHADKARDLERELAAQRDEELLLLNEFLGELDPLLTDDQRTLVDQYRDQNAFPAGDADDARNVLRAARRLRLEAEQRAQLRVIERDTIASIRKIPRRDAAAQVELAAATRGRIEALLTEAQRSEFEEHLRGPRRPERGAPPPPDDDAPEKP